MRDNERGHLLISLDALERPAKQRQRKRAPCSKFVRLRQCMKATLLRYSPWW